MLAPFCIMIISTLQTEYNKHMLYVLLAVTVVGILLLANEFWWRRQKHHSELSRKFIHISVGSFVAVWPFFLTWNQIIGLSIAFLIVVAISKFFKVFQAIHSVQRPTWGEVFFAIAVGATALITQSKGVYAAALLQMSLADGLAAVAGLRYGSKTQYKVFGHTKSVVGTITFFAVSVALLLGYAYFSGVVIPVYYVLALAASATLLENLGVLGLDNLFVPLLIAFALTT